MQQCKTVTLRTRKCKNGMLSYYLDYYPAFRDMETMKSIRHESLGIYVYEKPINNIQRRMNREMAEKAETIRCMRYESIINERFGLKAGEGMGITVCGWGRFDFILMRHPKINFISINDVGDRGSVLSCCISGLIESGVVV